LPYERELIPNYDETIDEVEKIISNREIIEKRGNGVTGDNKEKKDANNVIEKGE
jgi:hypothetical protein